MSKERKAFISLTLIVSLLVGSVILSDVKVSAENDNALEKIAEYVDVRYADLSVDERTAMIEEVYNEKYAVDIVEASTFCRTINNKSVDEAYQSMLDKENYVVDLINLHSGAETNMSEWEFNLEYLQTYYEEITALPQINTQYIDSYIEDYTIVKATKEYPDAQINYMMSRSTSYDYDAAAEYAIEYAYTYNPSYPSYKGYGGDCANFISQCLYAGGKNMVGTPGTAASAQDWSNWFCSGNVRDSLYVSSTWRGANAFKNYWQSNASGYETFEFVGTASYVYGFIGDAISLLNANGSAYHTLIIVGYDPAHENFICAAHTDDTYTASLDDIINNQGCSVMIYNLR